MTITPKPMRLTWNPELLAPYESLWSIFVKVSVLNNMSLRELATLISKGSSKPRALARIDYIDTDWIDFSRFAMLLDVDEAKLRSGTLASLGIPYPVLGYAVRHCPECFANGFHCMLFDITEIVYCPLHHRELTKRCLYCAGHSTFISHSKSRARGERSCTGCGLVLPSFAQIINRLGKLTSSPPMTIHCDEFVHWWQSLERKTIDRNNLLKELVAIRGDCESPFRGFQLHFAQSFAECQLKSWEFSSEAEPCEYRNLKIQQHNQNKGEWVSDAGVYGEPEEVRTFYRSLRKHLFKSYIRHHKACYSRILGLDVEECLNLDGDSVCPVALGFVIWRMSIENLVRVAGLRAKRKGASVLRLMGPSYHHLPVSARLRWSYFGFFGIIRKLVEYLECRNMRIEVGGESFDGHVCWTRSTVLSTGEGKADSDIEQSYSILFPDLERFASSKCTKLHSKPPCISLISPFLKGLSLVEYPYEEKQGNLRTLFLIRPTIKQVRSNQFVYIYV
jgi:hypothetical protein